MLPVANPFAEYDSVDGDWSIPARQESHSPSLVSTPVCLDGRVARQLSEGSFEGGLQLPESPSLEDAQGEGCNESAQLRKKPLPYVLDRGALFDAGCKAEALLQTEPSSPDGYTSAFSSSDKLSECDACSLGEDQRAETWDGDDSDLERRTLVSRLRCSSFSEKRTGGKLLEQRSKLCTDPPRSKLREKKGRRGGWWRLATFRPFAGSSRSRACAEADVEALLGGDGGDGHAKVSSYSAADQELAAAAGRLQRLRLFRSKRS
ncbi:hypothetical protein H632_c2713p0 [Helicosporidium sp. ATCC 50920]|nr:hypothetical protein H632_c2713p0 [Helicosporidium sp. ATCC 50920]|eukprot:KDD72936.1 hypothetical protein H632_c2713p0 [Helicosporidium sp. ATCC 50920]